MTTSEPAEIPPRPTDPSLRLFIDSVVDYAIFLLTPEGHIASWNRGAERFKGYTEAEILGLHFSVFYTQEDRDRRYPEHELRVATRDGRFEDEGWRIRKDGSRFWANVVITALYDSSGALVGFGKVTRDLTERRQAETERTALERERIARQRAEELAFALQTRTAQLEEARARLDDSLIQLQRSNAELETRREEAERASAEAVAANRAKSDFLANMSHELRTPINAIIGYTELLHVGIPGPVTEAQQTQLGRIESSSRHLLGLIEDVLDLSKIEAGQLVVVSEPASLAESISRTRELVEPLAAARKIEIIDRCAGADLRFMGDDARLRQILINLISNAVKFTDEGGTIEIDCSTTARPDPGAECRGNGPWIALRVRDDGVGIPPDQLQSVFDAFTQLETRRSLTRGGVGLGLTISRQLARLMGGDLTVSSEVGEGSCFTVWLPVYSADRDPSSERSPEPAQESDLSRLREPLIDRAGAIIAAVNGRLRQQPFVTALSPLSGDELSGHQPAFLAALAGSLALVGTGEDQRNLMSDSRAIRRHIAERHGAQRTRLGWTLPDLRLELEILREETERALITAGEPLGIEARTIRAVLGPMLEQDRDASVRAFLAERPGPR